MDDATLTRYLSGSSGPAEAAEVERWLDADPANRALLERLRAAWNPPPIGATDPDDRMWHWIAARMEASPPRPILADAVPSRQLGLRRWALVAAALVLVAGGAWLAQRTRIGRASIEKAGSAFMRELVTSRGERATANLPDGTRVILGPESRLQIPTNFAAAGGRDVQLQGEAFFQASHDSTRPFRVHTATGIAEDLGTDFVVTAYPENRTTRVVVSLGKVALRPPTDTSVAERRPALLTLQAGDLGRIDEAGSTTLTRQVDLSKYVGWTEGRLAFDEVPLPDAIERLARWYDLDIRLADSSLAGRRFTATFHDEGVARVLHVLEVALDVRVEQRGRLITLRAVPPAAQPNR
jgi:ferric-dicitrate binding protein FerR (iron transport regulator)